VKPVKVKCLSAPPTQTRQDRWCSEISSSATGPASGAQPVVRGFWASAIARRSGQRLYHSRASCLICQPPPTARQSRRLPLGMLCEASRSARACAQTRNRETRSDRHPILAPPQQSRAPLRRPSALSISTRSPLARVPTQSGELLGGPGSLRRETHRSLYAVDSPGPNDFSNRVAFTSPSGK
jgi:hypothetical protein